MQIKRVRYRFLFRHIYPALVVVFMLSFSCNTETLALYAKEMNTLPDFSAIKDVTERKQKFFDFMRPIIQAENDRVLKQRKRLLELYEKHHKKPIQLPEDLAWLDKLVTEYKANKSQVEYDDVWEPLLKRVDIVPVSLALIQSAKETGWGTSRFARLGNNMFGQQCFTKSCGIVPDCRVPGATHEVATFKSVNESVRSYIYNINTGRAYSHLRQLRFEQRQAGKIPDGHTIAGGLFKYSERGMAYVKEVRAMIRVNKPFMDLS